MKEKRGRIGSWMALCFSAAALLLLLAATASAAEGPAVMITDYSVAPEVLMPGDTGTITYTFKAREKIDAAYTVEEAMKLLTSFAAGKTSGGGTGTVVFRDTTDSTDRISMNVDTNGNRSSVTIDES